jgi:ketosteroid isomerase-like protein
MATAKKEDVSAAIKAGNAAIGAMLKTGDAKGIAGKYTKTAKLLPPNAPVQKGHAAIARYWQGAIDMGVAGATLRSVDVDIHGTTANELGTYTLKDAKGTKLDTGKYIVIWKKEGGAWKLHWDMFSSNNPA